MFNIKLAMSFLHCSGYPPLAIFSAACSLIIIILYLFIARAWFIQRQAAGTNGIKTLNNLILVFLFCALCGYLATFLAVFGAEAATFAYWCRAALYPFLIYFSYKAFKALQVQSILIQKDLRLAHRIRSSTNQAIQEIVTDLEKLSERIGN